MTMGNGTTDSWKTLPEEIILETGVRMTSYWFSRRLYNDTSSSSCVMRHRWIWKFANF
jgi:hypothetical protein